MSWRTSKRCASNGTCVAVGTGGAQRAIGDTKTDQVIKLNLKQFRSLVFGIKSGSYDL